MDNNLASLREKFMQYEEGLQELEGFRRRIEALDEGYAGEKKELLGLCSDVHNIPTLELRLLKLKERAQGTEDAEKGISLSSEPTSEPAPENNLPGSPPAQSSSPGTTYEATAYYAPAGRSLQGRKEAGLAEAEAAIHKLVL
ncbi:hypothetical protein COY95_00685, partial [Candidatus Woesearchaeota archaeon CG_4_10_14_0_8_um_filter_47_5]